MPCDTAAVLPANMTLTNGVGVFSVILNTIGTQSITATDTSTSSITGVQSGIAVTNLPTTHFNVTGFLTPINIGTASSVMVTALDVSNKITANYSGTVAITSSDTAAVLPANMTLTNGVGVFSVTLNTVGTQSITATDTSTNSITGAKDGIAVTNLPTNHFSVTGFTSPNNIGIASSVTVTALDASNKITANYSGTVAITSSDTAAVLPANAKLTNGVGVFSVTLNTVGTQSITAIDTNTSGITGAQNGIVVQNIVTPVATVAATAAPTVAATSAPVSKTNSAANQSSDSIVPIIETFFDPALALPGETVTLVIAINNEGPDAAHNVSVTDPLPGQLDLIAVATTQGTYAISDQATSVMPVLYRRGAYLANGQIVRVHVGDLQPGQQATVTIQARVNPSVVPPLTTVATATLASDSFTARTVSAVLRVTAGVLPGTGEVPDNNTFNWLGMRTEG